MMQFRLLIQLEKITNRTVQTENTVHMAIITLFCAVFLLILFDLICSSLKSNKSNRKNVAKMILGQILGRLEITLSAGRAGSCGSVDIQTGQATGDCAWHQLCPS